MTEVWAALAGFVLGGGVGGYLAFHLGREVGAQEAITKVAEG